MIFNLQDHPSIANLFIAQLRDVQVQQDRMRFRRNLERLGEIFAYEISKKLTFKNIETETPLGIAASAVPKDRVVLATILRAGLPLHQGMMNVFDDAEHCFISAYRRHHKDGSFEIKLEYVSCPDLEGSTLILADPMLATGASMVVAAQELRQYGKPAALHFVTAIASREGLDHVRRLFPKAHFWVGAIDEELTAKSYIVPGLGDAGDLSFGAKVQE